MWIVCSQETEGVSISMSLCTLPHTHQQEAISLTDIFSYLEQIQDCLHRAKTSEQSCLDGIRKADAALKQCEGDTDILCHVLMKRAQLLYISVQKNYHVPSNGSQHVDPLKGCIRDCEHGTPCLPERLVL